MTTMTILQQYFITGTSQLRLHTEVAMLIEAGQDN